MAFTKVVGAGIHTQSNIDSHNINSTGIITATKFDGPFDNIVIGGGGLNISGVVTSTGLDVNGNGDISGNLVVGGNFTANGDFTTLNTTLREVELLRVDADASVAAGIITQTGAGDILRLYDGTSQVVTVLDTGEVGIATDNPISPLHVRGTTHALGNGGASLVWGNNSSLGTLTYSGTNARITASNDLQIHSTKLRIAGGTTESADGAFDDLIIGNHSGNRGISILSGSSSQGALGFAKSGTLADGYVAYNHNSTATDSSMVIKSSGKIQFNPGSSEKFTITDTGIVQFKGSATSDNNKMQISINNTENKILGSSNSTTNKSFIFYSSNTNVSEKLRITDTGILLLGRTSGSFKFDAQHAGEDIIRINNSGESSHGDVDAKLVAGGSYYQNLKLVGSSFKFNTYNGSSEGTRWKIDSSGHFIPETAGAVNIGSASAEIGDVYIADNKKAYFGSEQDFQVSHNGSHAIVKETTGRLYVLSDNLWFKNQADNSTTARFLNGDSVLLYYAGDLKLQTTSAGITVTGEVAASQDYPNFRPTLDFNFAATKKLDPRITYSRTGPASFTNEFGQVVLVGGNIPRFDHDPVTRESKGLLIENSRTNLYTYSSNLSSDVGWGNTRITVTVNTTTTPDKTNSASTLTVNSGGSYAYAYVNFTTDNGTSYAVSGWFKYINCQYVWLLGGEQQDYFAYFDIQNGTIGTTNGYDCTITAYPDGWYRCTATRTKSGSTGSEQIGFGLTRSNNNPTDNQVGDAVYAWGAQQEVGAFPTSYIPTNGSTATRGDDSLVIDGEDFTNFINPSEGTILADYKVIGGYPYVMYLSNNTVSRRIGLYEAGSAQTRFIIGNSGTQADTTDSTGTTVGDNIKSAGAYKLNDVAASKNGAISSTDSSVTIPPDLDRAYIGAYFDGNVSGIIGLRRLIYYQQRLPNSQLKTLTS